MSAETDDVAFVTLTKAEFDKLSPANRHAVIEAKTNNSSGKHAATAKQDPKQQTQKLLYQLFRLPKDELPQLLSALGYPPREAVERASKPTSDDPEVIQLREKVAQLERQMQTGERHEETRRLQSEAEGQTKERLAKDEETKRLLAEAARENERLRAEVERLKNNAGKDAKLGERQGVAKAGTKPPTSSVISLPASTRDEQAVLASNNPIQAIPDNAAARSGSPKVDMPNGAPEDDNLEAQPPSSSSQSVADPSGNPDVDMSDADLQDSTGRPASKCSRSSPRCPAIVDVEASKLPQLRRVPDVPKFTGPYSKKLPKLLEWGEEQFPRKGLAEFTAGEQIGAWAFHQLMDSWPVIDHSGLQKFVQEPGKLEPRSVPRVINEAREKRFVIILCHVKDRDQLSKTTPNHFVVAVVDWREAKVDDLTKRTGGRRGRSGNKSGKFTHWRMDQHLAANLKNDSEGAFGFEQGSLDDVPKELGEYAENNTCLLQCISAVRSYLKEEIPQGDQFSSRFFYLNELLLGMVRSNNEACEETTSSTTRGSQNDSCGPTASTADMQTAVAGRSLAAGPSQDKATIENPLAAPLIQANDGSAPQTPHYTSATFTSTRKPLPDGRKLASPTPSQVDAARQVRATPIPPPLSSQVKNDAVASSGVCDDVEYRWITCDGGEILVLLPTPVQYRELKNPKCGSPVLFAIAEELGAQAQGAFIIDIPKDCRSVLPERPVGESDCTVYYPEKIESGFWRIRSEKRRRRFPHLDVNPSKANPNIGAAIQEFQMRLENGLRGVAYETDIPAHTREDRARASLPGESSLWPIPGQLPKDGGIVGLHTPTGYIGAPGAPFLWHFEDLRLGAMNTQYCGHKAWFVTPPNFFDRATETFIKILGLNPDHDQFLRHEALHGGVDYLRAKGIPTTGFLQRPWQTVVLYPGAYHSGFSVTNTLAEAVNYAGPTYTYPEGYRPCKYECETRPPITYDLVFSPNRGNEAARTGEEETAPGGGEEKTAPRTLRQRRPITLRPVLAAASRPPKRKRPAGRPSSASRTGQRDSRSHEPEEQDELQDEPITKRNKISVEVLAEELLRPEAEERIRSHALALVEYRTLGLPKPRGDSDWLNYADYCCEFGARWDRGIPFCAMMGLTMNTRSLETMYHKAFGPDEMYTAAGTLKQLPTDISDQFRAKRREMTDDAFATYLKRLRKYLKIDLDFLPFMPYNRGGARPLYGITKDYPTCK
ncbi:hypothetical protein RB593_009147 [Gaeumannomyces tritici]